eukprot:jgi/Bigna1/127990/aug1.5_g2698
MESTAEEVIKLLLKKKSRVISGVPSDYSLYVAQAVNADELFERRLEAKEVPLELQEKVRVQGHLHQFRFHLRKEGGSSHGGGMEDNDMSSPEAIPKSKRRGGGVGRSSAASNSRSPNRTRWGVIGTGGGGVPTEGKKKWWSNSPRSTGGGAATASTSSGQRAGKCGYLEKKGPRDTAFRMRWFVLQQFLVLIGITVVAVIVNTYGKRLEGSADFRLVTPDKSYHLKAETAGDVNEWVRHVKAHSTVYKENEEFSRIQRSIEKMESRVAESDTEALRSLLSFKTALETPRSLDLVHEYLKSKHCEENLDFFLSVTELEKRIALSNPATTSAANDDDDDAPSPHHRQSSPMPNPVALTPFGTTPRQFKADLQGGASSSSTSSSRNSSSGNDGRPRFSSPVPAATSKLRGSSSSRVQWEAGREDIAAEAKEIFDRFIDQSSPTSLCISRRDREYIKECLRSGKFLIKAGGGNGATGGGRGGKKRDGHNGLTSSASFDSAAASSSSGDVGPATAVGATPSPKQQQQQQSLSSSFSSKNSDDARRNNTTINRAHSTFRGSKSISSNSAVQTCFSRIKRMVLAVIETQQFNPLRRTAEYHRMILATPYVLRGGGGDHHKVGMALLPNIDDEEGGRERGAANGNSDVDVKRGGDTTSLGGSAGSSGGSIGRSRGLAKDFKKYVTHQQQMQKPPPSPATAPPSKPQPTGTRSSSRRWLRF